MKEEDVLFDSGIQIDYMPSTESILSPDGRSYNIADKFHSMTTSQIRKIVDSASLPYYVMALNIQCCLNIGNMVRSTALCGARRIILFGRTKFDARGCVGAQNYIAIERIDGIRITNPPVPRIDYKKITDSDAEHILDETIFINYIKSNNLLPVFIEQDKHSRLATNYNIQTIIKRARELERIPVFILGNESFGMPKNILDIRSKLDISYTLELKQMGCIRSYNVANCCSILCYKIMESFNELAS
jgi:tRNA G18 (ribose-2'-O)-methylase SpoU